MNRYAPSRIVLLAAAFALSVLLSAGVQAASLGQLKVHSRLGQTLSGEIEVSGSAEELAGLSARVASPDAYRAADVDYDPALRAVRVTVERKSDTKALIRVSSEGAFNVPFADLLIDTRWTGGGVTRDFTFLLDLPDVFTPAVAVAPAPAPRPAVVDQTPPPAAAAPVTEIGADKSLPSEPKVKDAFKAVEAPTVGRGDVRSYTTQAGDNLSKLAEQFKDDGVSPIQMMAAIYQANPKAFANGRADRLKKGAMITVPDREDASKLRPIEARKLIVKVSSGFEAYRKQVAGAAKAGDASEGDNVRASSGQIKPEVQDSAAPERVATGRLRVGRSESSRATKHQIEALEDEIASKAKALEEQNARIQELQATQEQLNKLLAMQQEASAPAADIAASSAPAPVATAETSSEQTTVAEQTAPPVAAEEASTSAAPVKANAAVMKNTRQPDNWYEDPLVLLIVMILGVIAIAWIVYRRYKERAWRKADRQLQRERGMPVDDSSMMSVA